MVWSHGRTNAGAWFNLFSALIINFEQLIIKLQAKEHINSELSATPRRLKQKRATVAAAISTIISYFSTAAHRVALDNSALVRFCDITLGLNQSDHWQAHTAVVPEITASCRCSLRPKLSKTFLNRFTNTLREEILTFYTRAALDTQCWNVCRGGFSFCFSPHCLFVSLRFSEGEEWRDKWWDLVLVFFSGGIFYIS